MKIMLLFLAIALNLFAINHPPYMDENITTTQVQKLLESDGGEFYLFGYSVSIDGDYAIIGTYKQLNTDTASAYIFKKNSEGIWSQVQTLTASDTAIVPTFGSCVSISDNYAIVGAFGENSYAGKAYIFKKEDNGTWSKTQEINASDAASEDYFGKTISIDGDYAIVGASGKDLNDTQTDTGAAYIFYKESDGTWSQVQKITASDAVKDDSFGSSVSIDGDYAVVGARKKDVNDTLTGTGATYIFHKENDGTWSQVQELNASDAEKNDYFGSSVSIDGDYIVVGANGKDASDEETDTGVAYIFHKDSNETWSQTQEIIASNAAKDDYFGKSVSLDKDTIVVGAYKKNNYEGNAYIFQKDTNGTFLQKDILNASDKHEDSYFSYSVAISDGYVIVGAYGDDRETMSGSSYIFKITHDIDVEENNTFVEDLNISDPDDDDFNLTMEGVDSDEFNLDSNGTLTFKTSPDHENPTDANGDNIYEISVTARDDLNATNILHIKVTVVDNDDEDNDSISDKWEREYFGNLDHDGSADSDGDGLSDKEEFDYHTNPIKADTDGDGVSDKDEIDNGTDPNANDNLPPYMDENITTTQLQKLSASDGYSGEYFGHSVSMDGDWAIVGTSTSTGAAYIFEKNSDGTWSQTQEINASDTVEDDKFGYSVSISGDYAIIGAYQKDDNIGAAYIFKKSSDGTWSQLTKIIASDGMIGDNFGYNVSIHGDYALVGANQKDEYTGSAYIFKKESDGDWSQVQKLTASDPAKYDNFGNRVFVDDNFAIVGAYKKDADNGDSDTGSAYIFEKKSDGWVEVKKLTANDAESFDYFGYSVCIDDNFAVVGAYRKNANDEDTDTGSVYIFKRGSDNNWSQTQELTANDAVENNKFGYSVFLDKDTLVVGAYGKNNYAGGAYIFQKGINGTFIQSNILNASDGYDHDDFGNSVAISDGYVIVGAYLDDDKGYNSGSSYIFKVTHDIDVLENNTFVEDLNITDPEEDDFNITMDGVDSDEFNLDSNGTLTFKTAPDHENPSDANGDNIYEIRVTARDDINASNILHIKVTVTDNDDEDNDTLSDNWERQYFGNLDQNASGDYDNDGLTNADEYNYDTNPTLTDTDGDGLSDSDEINIYDTNASNSDSDSDGINDYDEINTYDTNATNSDSDGDGTSDGVELNFDTNATDSSSFVKLNQDANQTKGYIILTPNEDGKAGSAFINTPHDINDTIGFEAKFKMEIKSIDGADGMAFILQNDDRNETAVGGTGGAIGYADINNSIAVAFVTYTTNELRIYKNGDMDVVLASTPFPSYVKGGGAFYVWVDYVVSNQEMRVYLSQSDTKPVAPLLRYATDINSTLNGRAFVGFSAGTGGVFEEHDVYSFDINWTVDSDKDGLLDSDESRYGTDPNNDDTDGDGTKDGLEVKFDTNATDSNSFVKINQDAYENGDYIVLTPNDGDKAGSAFINTPHDVNDTTGFNAKFKIEIRGDENDADGMAFILQNDDRNETAVGGTGGNIGYADINNSIAVAFITYETNEIRILKDGNVSTVLASTPFPIYVKGGGAFYVWVDYTVFDQNLTIYTSQNDSKPTVPLLQYTMDLNNTLKGRSFIGFSAGTGGLYEEHDVYSVKVDWTIDSDKDGLTDSDEINIYDTNATNPDTDGDGLLDGEEINTYDTNATNSDTDGDGLNDNEEINTYDTNASNADTDGDTINDYDEIYTYGTSPTNSDSDGDGINDADEIANGTDPTTPSLTIAPAVYLFGTNEGIKTFQVTNTGSGEITLSQATLEDGESDRFLITSDLCNEVTLAHNEECNITVSFPSSSGESLSTTLNVSNVRAFIYNYESQESEASRRLPPVINDLNISESMNVGEDYNLTFSIVGYDNSYKTYMAFFNCENTQEGECGDSYNSSERFDQALELQPYLVEQSTWSYNGEVANEFHYSYVFTPSSDDFNDGNTSIVIRFYYKTDNDEVEGDASISLIIPGNLSEKYYDTSGRKIEKTIVK